MRRTNGVIEILEGDNMVEILYWLLAIGSSKQQEIEEQEEMNDDKEFWD